jgi:hypothetical protein
MINRVPYIDTARRNVSCNQQAYTAFAQSPHYFVAHFLIQISVKRIGRHLEAR